MSRISSIVGAVDDTQVEKGVEITAWGIKVDLRGMTLLERSQYVRNVMEARDAEDEDTLNALDAYVVIDGTYDPEDGTKAFTAADVPMLKMKAAAVIAPLSAKILRLSGLDEAAEERLGKGFSTSAATDSPAVVSTLSVDSSSTSPNA